MDDTKEAAERATRALRAFFGQRAGKKPDRPTVASVDDGQGLLFDAVQKQADVHLDEFRDFMNTKFDGIETLLEKNSVRKIFVKKNSHCHAKH